MSDFTKTQMLGLPPTSRCGAAVSANGTERAFAPGLSPMTRDVIGAWLVCLVIAVACFVLLTAAGPGRHPRGEALISLDAAATVAAAEADRAEAHRHGRC
jgi:hypothetical protein